MSFAEVETLEVVSVCSVFVETTLMMDWLLRRTSLFNLVKELESNGIIMIL